MEVRAGCTIAAKEHWAVARVVAESFLEHHPGVPFYALLADEPGGELEPAVETFEVVPLEALALPRGRVLLFRYPQQPLTYALAPFLLRHVLDKGHERVLFIKQESLVTASLDVVFSELEEHSIALTPHLLEPLDGDDAADRELPILLAGAYNGGIVGVANRPQGRAFLAWWQDRVEERCVHDVGEGLHFEQRWLDLVPAYFEETGVLRDPGVNVGHWNLGERDLRLRRGRVMAGESPCSLVRFSGFDEREPDRVSRYRDLKLADIGAAAELWRRYAARLAAAGVCTTRGWPYAYGRFDDGTPIPDLARELHRELGSGAARFGDPFRAGEDSFRAWLDGPAGDEWGAQPAVTRLWDAVYRRRPDLQSAFPDHLGGDRRAFVAWTVTHGSRGQ